MAKNDPKNGPAGEASFLGQNWLHSLKLAPPVYSNDFWGARENGGSRGGVRGVAHRGEGRDLAPRLARARLIACTRVARVAECGCGGCRVSRFRDFRDFRVLRRCARAREIGVVAELFGAKSGAFSRLSHARKAALFRREIAALLIIYYINMLLIVLKF